MIEDRLEQDNAYNHLEQLTEVEDTVSYTYDANGNRATMVSKVDDVVYATTTYSYNLANMVVSMTNDPSNESAQTFTYTYYLDGNQRTKTEGTKVTTYAYDYAGRLVSEVTTDNGTPSVGYTYTYDDFGNRLTMTTDGVTTNYTYDLNNRLLQTTANETTVTYTYNANGDMITEYKVVENIPEQNTTYTYSVYTGMLTSVSSTVGNVNASYDYNASGLRMKNGDTYFIYDGQNIVAEYDLANDEYTAVYGFAVNRVSRFTSGVDGEIYLFNAHGDVVALVAISGENVGKTIKEYDYDAFGNEVFPDPDDNNPFRYCGEYYDKGTNRLYLRARDYDASTGRFTQQDNVFFVQKELPNGQKIIDPLSLNMYTYCANNPIMYQDPSGNFFLTTMAVCAIAGMVIGGMLGGAVAAVQSSNRNNGEVNIYDVLAGIGIGMAAGAVAGAMGGYSLTFATGITGITVGTTGISAVYASIPVWAMDQFARGFEIERMLGGMCNNFPVIDKFIKDVNNMASSITSIKSIDLMTQTYQNGNTLYNIIMKYGNQLASFSNTRWKDTIVLVNESTARILEIAIPPGATQAQIDQILRATEELGKVGVEIVIHVIK